MSGQLSLRDYLIVEERLFSSKRQGWIGRPAGPKMGAAVLSIAVNVVAAKFWISAALFAAAAAVLLISRVPRSQILLFLLAPAWATLLVVVGMSVGFGTTPLFHAAGLTVTREGLLEGLNAAMRVGCDMSWMAALFLTTPFSEQMRVLRKIRIPAVLLDTLSFMYRYVFLLWDEFVRMKTAAQARGGMASRRRAFETISRIAAQIFLRAYDRAGNIHLSIQARGGGTEC
ncbi:cobalt ECF transporter T component CbiQ [bacterium]|nr:cobalt ECF transporter T component CbiQ [bacterium]